MSDASSQGTLYKQIDTCPDGDLDVVVREYERHNEYPIQGVTFKTQRKVVISSSEDNVKAVEIWLRCFHETLQESLGSETISVAEIWHIIMAGDKYGFELPRLYDWLVAWFAKNTPDAPKSLTFNFAPSMLFPCYAFNYAEGFQIVTRRLAYHGVKFVHEVNPTSIYQMHMPQRIIQQINAAKGRLRNIFLRELNKGMLHLLDAARCNCKEMTFYNFHKELRRIKVYPPEEHMASSSIDGLLQRLKSFDSSRMTQSKDKASLCQFCAKDWKETVCDVIPTVGKYFDGQCLDCLENSKNTDQEYWSLHLDSGRYDEECRITHGEPAHYFSFMGRREKRGLIADA
ncbi:hypothetical protein P170DRAFT_510254 [Aspergillus steynii IBT 23096]|uniref:Uncharacterized protein n=1 Tax=Aspergillus steynii IBT 23096 TaxID=1392250 RepID=A0A2I2GAA2_9EURO|nr:uncharacterized protein P170DRAFT_510254 [Aspergillus steynii IBT 23096]PLB49793.1 hypothetical protein P170DRAFT_510254 [Aspergillus steynii IBT 23096]